MDIQLTESQESDDKTFRSRLQRLFHSYKFHLAVIGLVVVDCIIVIAELMIELHDQSTEHHHQLSKILHCISLAILSAFTIEIALKFYAFGLKIFLSKSEIFDAFVVLSSLVLDIVFFDHKGNTAVIGDLIVLLRLWRVVRVIHGIVLSVKTPIEHALEKERERRENAEAKIKVLTQKIQELEKELAIRQNSPQF